jgi:hypothetical protein
MEAETRSERTERLLTQRLEELARALERSGASAGAVGRLLELASVATMHAVALDLVSAGRADLIWRAAVESHPALETVAPSEPVHVRAAA